MKTIVIIMMLVCGVSQAQKVQVFDYNDTLLNEKPIDKSEVRDFLSDYPDGKYKVIELKGILHEGKILRKQCYQWKITIKKL